MPQREKLLQYVLDGLRSTRLKELVESKLKTWFPSRHRWGILNAMAGWPNDRDVIDCLFKAIYDENLSNKLAAARSLAKIAAGDLEIASEVAHLASNAFDPMVRAVALDALSLGWPDYIGLNAIIDSSRHSVSPEIRLVSIFSRIRRNAHNDKDMDDLINFGSWEGRLSYPSLWYGDIALALIRGWPKSPRIKSACLEAIKNSGRQFLDDKIALRILLEGYPQDEEVANLCVDIIKNRELLFSFWDFNENPWDLLVRNFKDNPHIVLILDEWIQSGKHQENEVSRAALISRSCEAKKKLLSMLNESFPHWPVRALLEGWGMKDQEVAERLMQMAYGSVEEASAIGHLLPEIIADKSKCQTLLVELIKDSRCARPDFVIAGLRNVGYQNHNAIIETILKSVLPSVSHKDLIYNTTLEVLLHWERGGSRIPRPSGRG